MGSEEVEQSLTEISTAALRRVPFAQQEVSRLKGDVRALQVRSDRVYNDVRQREGLRRGCQALGFSVRHSTQKGATQHLLLP